MAIDLLAVAIIIGFVFLGIRRGTLASGLHIGVLILSYLAAYFAATRLAAPVAEATGLFGLLAGALVGGIALVGTLVILTAISSRLLRRDHERHQGYSRSLPDRIGGGAVGATQGILIALLLGWLGLWIEAGRATGSFDFALLSGPSIVRGVSQNVVGAGARAALGDAAAGRIGANLISQPAETLVGIQSVLDNPRIGALQDDALFWQYVSSGAYDQALNRHSFLGIAYDGTLRGQLVDLGLVTEPSRHDPRLFRNAARELLERTSPALRDLKSDPELHKLAQDPEIQRAINDSDTISLLAHPGFQRVLARALARTESQAH
jgi:hypothetical protein